MTDLKPCPSRPYGDDPRVQALVDALRSIAQRKTPLEMSHTEFCYADFQGEYLATIKAAGTALKQWEDGE